jgi:hypothetical protein
MQSGLLIASEIDGENLDRLTVRIIRETTELDFEMEAWLAEIGDNGPGRSCGQRAKAFAASRDRLIATERQKNRIDELLSKLEPALTVRNALVHGRVEFGYIQSDSHVVLQTLELAQVHAQARLCLSFEHIEQAVADLRQARERLRGYRSQRLNTTKAPVTDGQVAPVA